MQNINQQTYHDAIACMHAGGIVAYPTEGVYGLGCDPFNQQAVTRLLDLKQRAPAQGLILIAAQWSDVSHLTQSLPADILAHALQPQTTPITWLLPASDQVPPWVRGQHNTIAIRFTTHPHAKMLCQHYGQAVVSTSANLHGQPPLNSPTAIQHQWGDAIGYILTGELGALNKPSQIRDIITGEIVRP